MRNNLKFAMVPERLYADTSFVIICSMFVLMMTIPGLALFYGSLVSRKSLVDTMLQSVVLTSTISILWWLFTYSLCFAGDYNTVYGDFTRSFLDYNTDRLVNGIPEGAWCIFQLTFAIITPAVVTGAVVERALLWPLMLLANVWHILVYCPICHMVWGGGLLQQWGVIDTAGGLVIETCAGVSALVLCYMVGPRTEILLKTTRDSSSTPLMQVDLAGLSPEEAHEDPEKGNEDPDSLQAVLHIVGAGLLWVGWIGFNAGSAFTTGARASSAALNTLLAAACGTFAWFPLAVLSKNVRQEGMSHTTSAFHLMGGAIAGLCAATPSSGYCSPSGSIVIGAGSGILCYLATEILMARILVNKGFDDTVSCFSVHGVAGMWGTLMTGVFAEKEVGGIRGALHGNFQLLGVQALGVIVTCAWSAIGTFIIASVFANAKCLRATFQEEIQGMDSRRLKFDPISPQWSPMQVSLPPYLLGAEQKEDEEDKPVAEANPDADGGNQTNLLIYSSQPGRGPGVQPTHVISRQRPLRPRLPRLELMPVTECMDSTPHVRSTLQPEFLPEEDEAMCDCVESKYVEEFYTPRT